MTGRNNKTLISVEGEPDRNNKKPRKHKAFSQVFAPFLGPSKKGDPTHVKFRETG